MYANGGIESVTIVKANTFAEIEGNNVAICYYEQYCYPNTPRPISEKVQMHRLLIDSVDNISKAKVVIGFAQKFKSLRMQFIKLVSDFKPDVVIFTNGLIQIVAASMSHRKLRKLTGHNVLKIRELHYASNWYSISGNFSKYMASALSFFNNKLMPRFFDKTFCLTKTDLHDNFPRSRRHDFMPNPCTIDTSHCAVERHKVVIAAGRLADQKDFAELLRIWAQVTPHAPGWRLRIIGEGSLRKSLEAQAAELGITDTVEMPGFSKNVRYEMSSAEIYAMTSRYEGFGLVLVEAMSCGLPIVSYDLPYGPIDIITDSVDGYLVPNRDAKSFERRLLQLIAEPDLRRAMGENGRKRSADYAPEAIAQRWMQRYSELLHNHAAHVKH